MASDETPGSTPPPRQPVFATTHWSVVLAASRTDTSRAQAALEHLCRTYWYPIYAHVRRRGHLPEDAKDLTQAFFLSLLQHQSIANVDQSRGRFRSFLLGAVDYFLANEWARVRAQKRGGGQTVLSLDLAAAENRFDLEPAHKDTPDKQFDREWAGALLDAVLTRLEHEYRQDAKAELFEALKPALAVSRESQPYAVLAARFKMTEGALRVAVHRLRGRYRELLRAEIADTVNSPEEVRSELKHLFQVMSGG
jgi:RNA polymerase sigma-70 factor (ECF subfamily)